jgi:hypothetical protein
MRLIFRLVQCFVFNIICCQCVLANTTQESSFLTEWNTFFVLSTTALYEPRFSKISTFKTTIYKVGIHRLHNRKRLFEVYKPRNETRLSCFCKNGR